MKNKVKMNEYED